jgi:DTW domain-containing protein
VVWRPIAYPSPSPATEDGRPTCYRCMRPRVGCVCGLVQPVDNRTRVLIVQHGGERKHPFGTVRLAKLGLRNAEVHVTSRDGAGLNHCPPRTLPGAALLFLRPGATQLDLLPEPPSTLVVLDGTWSTAGKLRRDNPWLQALPCVSLAPAQPGRYRIRKAPRPAVQLSTIEAIVAALQTIEPDTPGLAGLIEAFDGMIDQQLALAHGPPRPR